MKSLLSSLSSVAVVVVLLHLLTALKRILSGRDPLKRGEVDVVLESFLHHYEELLNFKKKFSFALRICNSKVGNGDFDQSPYVTITRGNFSHPRILSGRDQIINLSYESYEVNKLYNQIIQFFCRGCRQDTWRNILQYVKRVLESEQTFDQFALIGIHSNFNHKIHLIVIKMVENKLPSIRRRFLL